MRFSTISAVCAFAAAAYAQTAGFDALSSPTQDQEVAAGSTLDIIWEPTATYNNDTVTITLLEGSTPSTLSTGPIVASSIASSAGKFSWAIPSDIGSFATYGFQLTLDSDAKIFQYSFPFHITGASSSSSTSSATGSITSAASTKTLTLSTGTAYTPISTSSTSSANSTTSVKTSYSASTLATVSSVKPTSNSTLTYVSPTATAATTTSSKTGSATTTSSPAAATTNAAAANIAQGSLALFGGLVLALAL